MASYAVGIVNYRAYADLDRCLTSATRQTLKPEAVFVVDVEPDTVESDRLQRLHLETSWRLTGSQGFAAGANGILESTRESNCKVDFVLILNPDVELSESFGERLVREMERHPSAGIATGKLLRPDGRIIDSAGITLPAHRRPRDRGSEDVDRGQFDQTGFVFGASGAALMLRSSALEDLQIDGEVFDEDFFLYFEDTDLCWRAGLFGWKTLYVPEARAIHQRGWKAKQRFSIDPRLRRHSFKNHYLQIMKNERALDFFLHLPVVAGWELARLVYALGWDREVLGGYRDAIRLLPRAWRKRRLVQGRARRREIGVRTGRPKAS